MTMKKCAVVEHCHSLSYRQLLKGGVKKRRTAPTTCEWGEGEDWTVHRFHFIHKKGSTTASGESTDTVHVRSRGRPTGKSTPSVIIQTAIIAARKREEECFWEFWTFGNCQLSSDLDSASAVCAVSGERKEIGGKVI